MLGTKAKRIPADLVQQRTKTADEEMVSMAANIAAMVIVILTGILAVASAMAGIVVAINLMEMLG